jgi:hypothetical protein
VKILFLSFFFPPHTSIGALRTGKTAKYLSAFGHDVKVISAVDQGTSASMAVEVPPESVVYTRWLNPVTAIESVARRAFNGASAAPGSARQPSNGSGGAGSALLQTIARAVRGVAHFPDAQIGWLPYARTAARRLMKEWRPDLILASSSPTSALILADMLAREANLPWVGDLRDLWTDNQYYAHPAWRRALEVRLERRFMQRGAAFVTVSDPLAETLRRKFGKPTGVIFNGFDAEDYDAIPAAPDPHGLHIVYTGSIYERWQSPQPLFDALALMRESAGDIRVAFYGSSRPFLQQLAAAAGVTALVEIHDAIPYAQVVAVQKSADALLHLLWNDPSQPGVYNAKIYEYLGARRPILAVGYTGNVTADLVRTRAAGVAFNEPQRIAAHLLQLLAQKRSGGIDTLPRAVSAGLSREEQTRGLEEFLLTVISHGAA